MHPLLALRGLSFLWESRRCLPARSRGIPATLIASFSQTRSLRSMDRMPRA